METFAHRLPADVSKTSDEIVRGINAGQTVIFCGAGISYNSGLPIVNQFTPYALLTLCTSQEEVRRAERELRGIENTHGRSHGLVQKACELTGVSDETMRKVTNDLPFEAFMETLADNSTVDRLFDIWDAETYTPAIQPNTNHTLLAKLVAAGKVKTIVTTNFDQLIEKALRNEGKTEARDYDVLYSEEEFEKINWTQNRIRLIKLHGSIHDKEVMAITLRQVAQKELSEGRANIIRNVFAEGNHKHVLILGYSCSDVFDVSPQIEVLTGNLKRVFLVEHSGGPRVAGIREQKDKNPFKVFDNDSKRLYLNTDKLVETLWTATLPEPYHVTEGDTPNWKEKVDAWGAGLLRRKPSEDHILGQLFHAVAEWPTAIRCYERGLAGSKEDHDVRGEGSALGNMGSAYMQLGEYRKAIGLYEQHLEIARRIGDVRGEGNDLGNMGLAYAQLGMKDKARECFEKSRAIFEGLGLRHMVATVEKMIKSSYPCSPT